MKRAERWLGRAVAALVVAGIAIGLRAEVPGLAFDLVGELPGGQRVEAGVADGRLIASDGSGRRFEVGPDVAWRVEGWPEAAEPWLEVVPTYQIRQVPIVDADNPFRSAWFAVVDVEVGEAWTRAELSDGVAVVIWLVDGRPVWVAPVPVVLQAGEFTKTAMVLGRELAPGEERGYPVVALRQGRTWVKPATLFTDRDLAAAAVRIHTRDTETARKELAAVKQVNRRSKRGRQTLLRMAARAGREELVRVVIDGGAKLDESAAGELTPLWAAAVNGRMGALRALVEASKRAKGAGWKPSEWATLVRRAQIDVYRYLLHISRSSPAPGALAAALWVGDVAGATDLLRREIGPGAELIDPGLIQRGVALGDEKLLKEMLAAGLVRGAAGGHRGEPWLVSAVRSGNLGSVETLLLAGFHADAPDASGRSAMMWAVLAGRADMVKLLLAHGADRSIRDSAGRSSADYAVTRGDAELGRVLLGSEWVPDSPPAEKLAVESRRRIWSQSEVSVLPRLAMAPEIRTSETVAATFVNHRQVAHYGGPLTVSQLHGQTADGPSEVVGGDGAWAVYSVVVEEDGSVFHATLVALQGVDSDGAFQQALAGARFEPGQREGQRVVTRVTLALFSR